MTTGLVNWLLVNTARILRISPGLAQVFVLTTMSIAFGAMEPKPFRFLTEPFAVKLWFGICAAVVLVTWLTKGKYRKIWWRTGPWQTNDSFRAWTNAADSAIGGQRAEPLRPSRLRNAMSRVDSRLVGGITGAAASAGFFQLVASLEQEGFRIQWLLAMIYDIGGNLLLSSVMGGFIGLIAWAVWPETRLPEQK